MDYSKTVNLPKTDFPMKADLVKREPAMLARWESEKVYEQALKNREPNRGAKPFILHDGPPYANGNLHLGHALNKVLKDIIVRSKTMAGYYAPYVPGWDCHGLPIELQLMKELKVTDKHKVDRDQFRAQAKAFAEKFVSIQRDEFKRMGILVDWSHPYLTMDEAYKKVIIETFEALQKKGYVYRGKKPVYWCTTDETALAEAEVEYENKTDKALYVAFPTTDPTVFYMVWTTTPWTLPANVAIAYNQKFEYVRVSDSKTHRNYILAKDRAEGVQKLVGIDTAATSVKETEFPKARHPWINNRIVPVVHADFVAMDAGTGLVHIAPGHGADDYGVGQKYKLSVLSPIDDKGLFTDEVPEWKGQHIFKANPLIIEFLKSKGLLLLEEEISHSYPHCWRCHRPVIFRATEQWFMSIDHDRLRERVLEAMEKVEWIPGFGKNRMTGMVESRPDWCLSRQRLWGTEIPAASPPAPLLSPTGDTPLPVTKSSGLGEGGRRPGEADILDVWFESGVSWAAVLKVRPELRYPADLYLEGSDQHRGWFQTSLIPSVALENQAPYKAVLTHGFVMDREGRPMSKSIGNVISPDEVIKQYGADVLRLWVASSDYAGDVRIGPEILKTASETYRKLRNTLRYLLNNLTDFDPAKDVVAFEKLPEMDQWAMHRLQEEIQETRNAYDAYEFHRVVSRLLTFCGSDLSGFYLDVIKDRLYCDMPSSPSRRSAQTVLYRLTSAIIPLLAPIIPFTADECWQFFNSSGSVASADFPEADPSFMNADLKQKWDEILKLRDDVMVALEGKRKEGLIKKSSEAQLRPLSVRDLDVYERLEALENLAALLMVSRVDLKHAPSMAMPWTVEDVALATDSKCARCWIYKTDVGANATYGDICGRCAAAVIEWQRANPEPAAEARS